MSSAPARILQLLGRVFRGLAWTAGFAILAASGAGLVAVSWHPPGSPARAELTYVGDSALDARLDEATAKLERIAADVTNLTTEAKTALAEVASTDPTRLLEALGRGGVLATSIDVAARDLRISLVGLEGDGPNAEIDYSNATLVRRAAIIAAIDAATSLATEWQKVTGRAVDASELVSLLTSHDTTVASAAAQGVAAHYKAAIPILDEALHQIEDIQKLRERLIASPEPTVLDEWIQRNTTYDLALRKLYVALVKAHGDAQAIEVQSAFRDEELALAQLPPDRRTIIVIVSEVARGGLTQAVVAIDDAHGRIDDALAEADLAAT
jgi:hypothetical protein